MIECKCVQRHVPLPVTFNRVKMEGSITYLCPTTYANVRQLLTEYAVRDTVPPGRITKHYSKYVREICFKLWKESKVKEMTTV